MELADIVAGVDGSDESFAALHWALQEAVTTGQKVNAVYGWTHSWDMGERPETDAEWAKIHKLITMELDEWATKASAGIEFDRDKLTLTSVHAAGSTALLTLGKNAQQIVVGRRSLNRLARWFLGSMSDSLVEKSSVPVTIVRVDAVPEVDEEESIENALSPNGSDPQLVDELAAESQMLGNTVMPIVVGIDGSPVSQRALAFAAEEAQASGRPLHVLYCWRMKSLAELADRTHAVPSKEEAEGYAQEFVKSEVGRAHLDPAIAVHPHAFHINPVKGLLRASRYANRLIVGSRGLHGLDAMVLGSVSRQLLDSAHCTVTIVH
ncbi:universal stress family protein [Parascardovia denticolens DSM 10105 = JCM 12538]|uniref:Universal stress family protein n=1 Tax=Parascardovia denticolens DSM 10105 = JCM 12538 TaxID=864564 RepID=E6K0B8_PARDN|nr:universal stress protein [Parascardovia denticolens]EFG32488.1 hypothetical protein HMPREF9017_01391 [Parascardovia denticolens F0305]EFT84191.1 universal stress family protein [Parascardovia denticolens DSM 10105 = JCM 12538]BAR04990.1 conserved hypothetical protein [Parascardovia denticolens DSM 10105 = JCM 12538]